MKENNKYKKVKEFIYDKKYIFFWIMYSYILTIFIESIKFGSLVRGIRFSLNTIIFFTINLIIVATTLSISLITKRRYFIMGVISLLWIGLSIINYIIGELRGMPIMFADIFLIRDGVAIASQYLNFKFFIIIILIIPPMGLILYKLFEYRNSIKVIDPIVCLSCLCFSIGLLYGIKTIKFMEPLRWDYKSSYNEFGFAYSLTTSIYPYLNNKPKEYSEDTISTIKEIVESYEVEEHIKKYNIIFVQLESFMDPLLINNIELSCDPIKNFRSLTNDGISGYIKVPTFGGGTVRSEFEVLTSINLDYLKDGEIPYNNILRINTVESIASVLNSKGYNTTAIHNYQGDFYNRDTVIRNMGFNRYISMEHMQGIDGSGKMHKDDKFIFDNIIKVIESDSKKDFIYAINVGTHSPYSTEVYKKEHSIQISGNAPQEYINSLQDFLIRIYQLDNQIGRLVNYIDNLEEPTLLVMFSDHLPNLPIINDSKYYNKDKYSVPYIIYSNKNLNMKNKYKDLEAYELSTDVFNLLQLEGGVMNKFHNSFREDNDYQNNMKLVQYDILYGKNYILDKEYSNSEPDMEFGIDNILINDIVIENDKILIIGEGFTENSKVFIDSKEFESEYKNSECIEALWNGEKINGISVKQVGGKGTILGSTEEFKVSNE